MQVLGGGGVGAQQSVPAPPKVTLTSLCPQDRLGEGLRSSFIADNPVLIVFISVFISVSHVLDAPGGLLVSHLQDSLHSLGLHLPGMFLHHPKPERAQIV